MTEKRDPGVEDAYAIAGPEAAKRLYAEWAGTYDSAFAARSGYRPARRVAETFVAAGGREPVLDAGCGTGLIADALPDGLVIDGIDISPDMLAQARAKGRYRTLVKADLTRPLPLQDGIYRGLVSAGTFTHGHVPPGALRELVRVLSAGAVAVLSVKSEYAAAAGFDEVAARLVAEGAITPPASITEPVYEGPEPPQGHRDDTMLLVTFERL